jgi:hypothetical protein
LAALPHTKQLEQQSQLDRFQLPHLVAGIGTQLSNHPRKENNKQPPTRPATYPTAYKVKGPLYQLTHQKIDNYFLSGFLSRRLKTSPWVLR